MSNAQIPVSKVWKIIFQIMGAMKTNSKSEIPKQKNGIWNVLAIWRVIFVVRVATHIIIYAVTEFTRSPAEEKRYIGIVLSVVNRFALKFCYTSSCRKINVSKNVLGCKMFFNFGMLNLELLNFCNMKLTNYELVRWMLFWLFEIRNHWGNSNCKTVKL